MVAAGPPSIKAQRRAMQRKMSAWRSITTDDDDDMPPFQLPESALRALVEQKKA